MAAAAAAHSLMPHDQQLQQQRQHWQMALSKVSIPAPLILPDLSVVASGRNSPSLPALQVEIDAACGALQIVSISNGSNGAITKHVSGQLELVHAEDHSQTTAQQQHLIHRAAGFLSGFASTTAMIKHMQLTVPKGATAAVAAAQHNDGCDLDVGGFDSWLQLGQVFVPDDQESAVMFVPAALELLLLPVGRSATAAASGGPLLAFCQPCEDEATQFGSPATAMSATSDYQLTSSVATAVCVIKQLTAKPMVLGPPPTAAQAAGTQEMLYTTQWQAVEVETSEVPSALGRLPCLILDNSLMMPAAATAVAVAAVQSMLLQAQEQAVQLSAAADAGTITGIAAPVSSTFTAAMNAMSGMLRAVQLEQPDVQLAMHAHDGYNHDSSKPKLSAGASTSDVFGSCGSCSTTYQPRLLPAAPIAQLPSEFQLLPKNPGSLDSLLPVAANSSLLISRCNKSGMTAAQQDVVVQVKAVGINFRDVLNVLGMYPGDPGAPGSDFSGVVVSGPLAGSAVFGLSTGALASHVLASAATVAQMPAVVSFEAAASTPTVFTTADAALRQIAQLSADEVLMIHGAAGGVGLAAVQAAVAAGARVVATASSSTKRNLLRSMGVKVVSNSRDITFASDVAQTGGVDVVLNSLTSPGMVAGSLSVLRQGGRFVEIGKRDIWAPAAVSADRPDVSYSVLAIDFMPAVVLRGLLQRLSTDLATGSVVPIRTAVHDITAVHAALRQMAQARHVGKVVVSLQAQLPSAFGPGSPASRAAAGSSGNVLVTGGTGALGRLVARWLAGGVGVRHMTLCSRTGKLQQAGSIKGTGSSAETSLVQSLHDPLHPMFNSMVTFTAGDVSSAADVGGLFAGLAAAPPRKRSATAASMMQQHPELVAMLHAGGVLSDAALINQTAAKVRRVAGPKATALQLLGQHLQLKPTAGNVFFSSVAALLGSAGQANYSAANAALDASAQQLQAAGLAVRSVQFSAWAGAGMAVETAKRVDVMGIGALRPQDGLAALEACIRLPVLTRCAVLCKGAKIQNMTITNFAWLCRIN
jgi:NADPH:quinone reductase-like Zn-dependent oxidoreductase